MEGFLEPYLVLDLTDERGALAGRLLADLGATVVQVEPPGGSPARRDPAFWLAYGHNKRSVVCDLESAAGAAEFERLCRAADFVVCSGSAGGLARRGLTAERVLAVNPAVIFVTITPFGTTGPKAGWADSDLVLYAAAGALSRTEDDRPPVRISAAGQPYLHAAAEAAAGALVAHAARRRSGRGQHVDVSAQESMAITSLKRGLYPRVGWSEPPDAPEPDVPSVWRTRDGYVHLTLTTGPATGKFTNAFVAWLAEEVELAPDIAAFDWRRLPQSSGSGLSASGGLEDPDGGSATASPEMLARLRAAMGRFFAGRDNEWLFAESRARRILLAPLFTIADVASSPQLDERDFWFTTEAGGRTLRIPGRFACTEPETFACRRPAPALGADADEVAALIARRAHAARGETVPGTADAPLAGLKVADFSWVLAGPGIGRVLADFGATVVRVETATRMDISRALAPFQAGNVDPRDSVFAMDTNAGKLGLALDMTTEGAREVARDLVAWSDVTVDSFSPGTMARWGLGHESLRREHPRLVMLSTSLLGQTGAFSRVAGYGSAGGALSGIHHLTGWPDLGPHGFAGPYTDFVAPRFGVLALLAALDARERTGHGAYVDLSQTETAIHLLAAQLVEHALTGEVPDRRGNRDPLIVPNDVFSCRDGMRVALSARSDDEWRSLCDELGLARAGDPLHGAGLEERRRREDEIGRLVVAAAAGRDAAELARRLRARGVPAHVDAGAAELSADEQLAHRDHFAEVAHPRLGTTWVESSRLVLSVTPPRVTRPGPDVGQDSERVLGELLGLSRERIARLAAAGALR